MLGSQTPWGGLVNLFNKRYPSKPIRRSALNPRVLIMLAIIRHMLNLDERATVVQITGNMYLHFVLGYSPYVKRPPFDTSLLEGIRKRLGEERIDFQA
ncbi:transposase [Algoriphagus resistens]|uniref:transposase n=1 Tax=Algoriphagus resistens TaxID=1750590 RepID=UPI00373FD90B